MHAYNYEWKTFYREKTRDFPEEHGLRDKSPSACDRAWYFKDPPRNGSRSMGYAPLLRMDVTRITGLRRGVPAGRRDRCACETERINITQGRYVGQ